MKSIIAYLLSLIALASGQILKAQGIFQNLNFESANPGPLTQSPDGPPYAGNVPVANALPGWSVYYGSTQQTAINVNAPSLGSTAVNLIAPGGGPIDGNYSVLLQGYGLEINGAYLPEPASISQIGMVPFGTQSILFDSTGGPSQLEVSIGGQEISFEQIGTGANYTIYGGNISMWAGQTEQLTFSAMLGSASIDDISFSSQAVPEPNTVELGAVAAALFGLHRLRTSSRLRSVPA